MNSNSPQNDVELMARYLPKTLWTPRLNATTEDLTSPTGSIWPRPGDDGGIQEEDALGFIELRVSLAALNINNPVDPQLTLCKDIIGDGTGFIDAFGRNTGIRAVPIKLQGVEVSDVVEFPGRIDTNENCDDPDMFGDDDRDVPGIYIWRSWCLILYRLHR